MKSKDEITGLIVGIIAPIASFIVYVAFFTNDADPLNVFKQLIIIDRLPHVISLCLLMNLIIFFMKINTNRDIQAKGIVFATFFYALIIIILKFL